MSSPTLTSFYTNYDPKLRPLKLCQQTAIVVNRSDNATPYLGPRGHLTQVLCNKYLLLFILIALQLRIFCSFLLYSLSNVESLIVNSCQSASSTGDIMAGMSNKIAGMALSAMNGELSLSNEMTVLSLTATLANTQTQSLFYLDLLADGYNYATAAAIQAGIQAAQNSTKSVNLWFHDELGREIDPLQDQIDNITAGLKRLESVLSNDNLFTNVSLSSETQVSLSPLRNITAPISISSELLAANSSTDFGYSQISQSYGTLVKETTETYSNKLNSTGTIIQPNISSLEQFNAIMSSVCPSIENLEAQFQTYQTRIGQLQRNALIVLILFGVVTVVPVTVYKYFSWQYLLRRARELSTPGSCADPAETILAANNPIVSWFSWHTALKFYPDDAALRVMYRWFFSYILTDTMLFLLGSFIGLIVLYSCEKSALSIVTSTIGPHSSIYKNSPLFSDNSTLTSSIDSWANEINGRVNAAQDATNQNLQGIVSTAYQQMRTNFANAASNMQSKFESQIQASGLDVSIGTLLLDSQVPLSSFVFSGVSYPQLNSSAIFEELNGFAFSSDSFSSQHASGPLEIITSMTEIFQNAFNIHLQLGMVLLSVWLLYVLVAVLYVLKPGVLRMVNNVGSRILHMKRQ